MKEYIKILNEIKIEFKLLEVKDIKGKEFEKKKLINKIEELKKII